MARDDIKNADDLIRVVREEVQNNVIKTPAGGLNSGWHEADDSGSIRAAAERMRTTSFFETALVASEVTAKKGEAHSPKQTDFDLLRGASKTLPRLVKATEKAKSSGKFKPITTVKALSDEGAPA